MQRINNNLIPTINNLPPPIHQSTPEANKLISAQSSSELDTDQDDMIDKTIKHVTDKLHETILRSDIGNNNSERTSAGNTTSINTPNVIDIWTPAITDNPLQDSTTAFQ